MDKRHTRVLIYSHDTFGLGHLRRCRSIAEDLVERHKRLSVLILSGSPIIGSFDFRARVDFVRIPGVIKLRNGEYSSLSLHMDIGEILALRSSIIQHTAVAYDPDIFIVDKEPLGLRGEIHDTLQMLSRRGVPLILGLRDVMDDPALLRKEWKRKNPMSALEHLYDQIWVYGLPEICEPLAGIKLHPSVARKIVYTGYLRRFSGNTAKEQHKPNPFDGPFNLVMTGGGGDGENIIDWVLRAYETDPDIPYPSLLVLGPFMKPQRRAKFIKRVERHAKLAAITFDARVEGLITEAAGLVTMGGYNTFCEILSFDKPAVIVPRRKPRLEQFIRASKAEELGLVDMLSDEHDRDPSRMARALKALPGRRPPSQVIIPGLLAGLDRIDELARRWTNAGGIPKSKAG